MSKRNGKNHFHISTLSERKSVLKECFFSHTFDGIYNCSCCFPNPWRTSRPCKMFEHYFDLFVRCIMDNESLKNEFTNKMNQLLSDIKKRYENNQINMNVMNEINQNNQIQQSSNDIVHMETNDDIQMEEIETNVDSDENVCVIDELTSSKKPRMSFSVIQHEDDDSLMLNFQHPKRVAEINNSVFISQLSESEKQRNVNNLPNTSFLIENVNFLNEITKDYFPLLFNIFDETNEIISDGSKKCIIDENEIHKDELNELEKQVLNDENLNDADLNDGNEKHIQSYKNNKLIQYFTQKNYLKFISKNFDYLKNEIFRFTHQLIDIFVKINFGDIYTVLMQINEEIKFLKHVKKSKNHFIAIIISKLCYLRYFFMHPDTELIIIDKSIRTNEFDIFSIDLHLENDKKKQKLKSEIILSLSTVLMSLSFYSYTRICNIHSHLLNLHSDFLTLASSRRQLTKQIEFLSQYYEHKIYDLIIACDYISMSYDGVTEPTCGNKFAALILDLIFKNGKKYKVVLEMNYFSGSAIMLNNWISFVFSAYNIDFNSIVKKIKSITTDNGGDSRKSRMSIGMKYNIRHSQCCCHKLSLIYEKGFDEIPVFNTVLEIVRLIRSQKYSSSFKKFTNNSTINLKRFCPTRWTSMNMTFLSFYTNYDEIINFLDYKNDELNNEICLLKKEIVKKKQQIQNIQQKDMKQSSETNKMEECETKESEESKDDERKIIKMKENWESFKNETMKKIDSEKRKRPFGESMNPSNKPLVQFKSFFPSTNINQSNQNISSRKRLEESLSRMFNQNISDENMIKDYYQKRVEEIKLQKKNEKKENEKNFNIEINSQNEKNDKNKKLKDLEDESNLLKKYSDKMKDINFRATVALILDILEFEKEIVNSIQGNSITLIEIFDNYEKLITFLNNIDNYEMENVFPHFVHFSQVCCDYPNENFHEAMDTLRIYVSMMINDINCGHLGHTNRLEDIKKFEYLYHIMKCPLQCEMKYYDMIVDKDEFFLKSLPTLKDKIDKKYQHLDIFTLSSFIENNLLIQSASYFSVFKLCSYDVEQFFSLLRNMKNEKRYNLTDKHLRDVVFIKYNYHQLGFDLNEYIDFYLKKKSQMNEKLKLKRKSSEKLISEKDDENSIFKTVEMNFKNVTEKTKDILLGDDTCKTLIEQEEKEKENEEETENDKTVYVLDGLNLN